MELTLKEWLFTLREDLLKASKFDIEHFVIVSVSDSEFIQSWGDRYLDLRKNPYFYRPAFILSIFFKSYLFLSTMYLIFTWWDSIGISVFIPCYSSYFRTFERSCSGFSRRDILPFLWGVFVIGWKGKSTDMTWKPS